MEGTAPAIVRSLLSTSALAEERREVTIDLGKRFKNEPFVAAISAAGQSSYQGLNKLLLDDPRVTSKACFSSTLCSPRPSAVLGRVHGHDLRKIVKKKKAKNGMPLV